MCFICFKDDFFRIPDLSKANIKDKMAWAKVIKDILKDYENGSGCVKGDLELTKLKELQYKLAREI